MKVTELRPVAGRELYFRGEQFWPSVDFTFVSDSSSGAGSAPLVARASGPIVRRLPLALFKKSIAHFRVFDRRVGPSH